MSTRSDLFNLGIFADPNGIQFLNPVMYMAGAFGAIGRGKTFFVDATNGAATNSGKYPDQALTTIEAAVNKCTANRGDVIYVLPGHTENISAATSLVCDKAGIIIKGLGFGTARPNLSFTAATATIPVSAANVVIDNIIFTAAYADVADAFTPTAKGLQFHNCEFLASATNKNFLSIVDLGTTDNQADGLTFKSCVWIEPDTATLYLVDVDADIDGLVVEDCYINLGVNTNDLPVIAGVATGKDLTNVRIINNDIIRLNDANPLLADPDTTTANTGICKGNNVRHLDTASELLITAGTNIGFFENKASAAVDASGYILPAVDS